MLCKNCNTRPVELKKHQLCKRCYQRMRKQNPTLCKRMPGLNQHELFTIRRFILALNKLIEIANIGIQQESSENS